MSKERIYIVSSSDPLFDLLKYNLGKRGYQIGRGTTEEDVEAHVQAFKPQVVIVGHDSVTDLSICKVIMEKAIAPRPKFIVLSPVAAVEQQAAGAGIDSFLIEPFTLEELIEKIDVILGDEQNINVFRQGTNIILTLKGNLDHHFSSRFRQALTTICSIGGVHLIIDFAGVEFLAHHNLMPLVTANARLEHQGGRISIIGLNAGLQDLFDKAGLKQTFKYFKDRSDAMRA